VKPDGVSLPPVDALCDVTNPLCGPTGAATVYGPQKGATYEMVMTLDEGLSNLAEQIEKNLGKDVRHIPGAGAAGGFGAGAIAFLGARLVPGVEAVAAACGLHSAVASADWVVTGEGSFDHQSLQGKVVSGICAAALKAGAKIAVLAGRVALCEREWREAGIDIAMQASPDLPIEQLLTQAEKHLRCAARQLARRLI